ncbi:gamma-glutamylcyclotransferase [Veronia nyctiphanis]|uniref:Gamma-glutamylcyclotransferase family protein n=1 Tax=Veronia nyctiphanis TaxID=1278244 RepID=A0A4V1LTB8_9GAMM|nr:gamma-glutamylcyclotransferase family protein [Veronia nyctiphanis]RXJ74648.1 gamma-glutamylcyclotransferase [Veronia nyctiphanis]
MNKVFVFGTLKEGFPNFPTNKGKRFRRDFKTVAAFSLYLVGERYSPWIIPDAQRGKKILGQVFTVNDQVLHDMDRLERITQPDGYRRITTDVVCCESGEYFAAFLYTKLPEQLVDSSIRRKLCNEYTLEHSTLYRGR